MSFAKNPTVPVNIEKWLSENSQFFLPPVCNKLLYGEGQIKMMYVGGPNTRKDFHIELGEEIFYQHKGDMVLPIVEHGKHRDVHIKEGEIFFLPRRIPHSPQRFKDTIGLVIERERLPEEIDGLRYYTPSDPDQILYQECFHCTDLGVQLKPVIERYFASEQYKTGKPIPSDDHTQYGNHLLPYPTDTETKVPDPFSLSQWISEREAKLAKEGAEPEKMYGGDDVEFQVWVHGASSPSATPASTSIDGDTLFWQWKGTAKVIHGSEATTLNEGDVFLLPPNTPFYSTRNSGSLTIIIQMIPRRYKPSQP